MELEDSSCSPPIGLSGAAVEPPSVKSLASVALSPDSFIGDIIVVDVVGACELPVVRKDLMVTVVGVDVIVVVVVVLSAVVVVVKVLVVVVEVVVVAMVLVMVSFFTYNDAERINANDRNFTCWKHLTADLYLL